jgi:hypothetical protein
MSPLKRYVTLNLYVDSFTVSRFIMERGGSFSRTVLMFSGVYHEVHDTLVLKTGNNVIKFKKETPEIYTLTTPLYIKQDTLNVNDKFFVTAFYYPNGEYKQTGSWNKNGKKDGVWRYYDNTGNVIRKRLFKDGALIDDDY